MQPPKDLKSRFKLLGPGLIAAATGVGAGDLIAALVAGTNYGMTFVWAIVLGSIIKYSLNEGVGRFHLVTGKTILEGWRSVGSWTLWYFGLYIIIWGFVYGAAGPSSTALSATAMFPQLSLQAWAIIHSLIALGLIWIGRYQLFEKVMTILTGLMFLTVVGSAILVLPGLDELALGFVPRVPDGSLVYALGLIGGVGGSITMASYGYWIREKKWTSPSWIPIMRLDSWVAYTLTALFTLALLIVGAEFLFGTGIEIKDEKGLITLAGLLGEKFGEPARWLFLLGWWSASFTSVLGVWNGVSYLFADWVRHMRKNKNHSEELLSEKSPVYRGYALWLTFPPMLLLFLGKPVGLIIAYGVLGAFFMPFLAITLIILLNRDVDHTHRNGWFSNLVLGASVLLFVFLAVQELIKTFE